MSEKQAAPAEMYVDRTSTRVIGLREIKVDGAPFHWWAVGMRPSLVVVRSSIFGGRSALTEDEPSIAATKLAKEMLAEHYQRAARLREQQRSKKDEKPEGGPADLA